MLWGEFCYTQILSPTCDRIPNTNIFPQIPKLEVKHALGVGFNIQNLSTALTLKKISGTLCSIAQVMWKPGGATAFNLFC